VVGLIGVFGPEQPSPELLMDQQILAGINKLQQSSTISAAKWSGASRE
jgi:hypothetical protein